MSPDALNLSRVAVRGTLWSYASFFSGKLMVLISTIILARLLSQDDFGVAGYALAAISLIEILGSFGVGPALIYQRGDPQAADTAFWLGLATSLVICILTWVAAPWIGDFFRDQRAAWATRILVLNLPIAALGNVHDMLLQSRLSFGKKFIPELCKALSKGFISIALALFGMGTWSLLLGQIAGTLAATIAFWLIIPWRPTLRFVGRLAKSLLAYGSNIVAGDLLAILYTNADFLLIGRYLGAALLGVYSLAFRIPDLLIMQFCNIISRIVFPMYANLREDAQAVQRGFLATTRYVSLVTVPLGLGLALVAQPMVSVLFSDKWSAAVPVIRAIAIYALFLSLGYNAGDVYKAQGKPKILIYLSLGRAVLLIPALTWAVLVPGTILAVGYTHVVVAFLGGATELVIAAWLLKLSFRAVAAALGPALLCGALMGAVVFTALAVLSSSGSAAMWLQLLVGVGLGGAVYLGALWIFQPGLVIQTGRTLRMALVR